MNEQEKRGAMNTTMNNAILAEIAYEGYRAATDGKSLISGQLLPPFCRLAEPIQAAWEAAAVAVSAVCGGKSTNTDGVTTLPVGHLEPGEVVDATDTEDHVDSCDRDAGSFGNEALVFLRRLSSAEENGAIVSSAACSEMEIAFARRESRFWVDSETSCGYVLRMKSWRERAEATR